MEGRQAEQEQEEGGDVLAPDPLRCAWMRDPAQRRLLPRLRANTRMMFVLVLITGGEAGGRRAGEFPRAAAFCGVVGGGRASGLLTSASSRSSFVSASLKPWRGLPVRVREAIHGRGIMSHSGTIA